MSTISEINIGTTPNDGTGDSFRAAMVKAKDNFTALNTDKAELSGATFTNSIGVSASSGVDFLYYTSGSLRWVLRKNSTAESGSNEGSDFEIISRTDAGASIATPLSIKRSNSLTQMIGVYNNTTASAANIFVGTDGSMLRSTSSEREKIILEAISKDFSKNIYEIAKKCTLFYKSKSENDNPEWTWYGLSAEKLAEIEPRLVHWGYFPEDYELIEKEVIRKVQEKNEKGEIVEKEVKEIEHEKVLKKDTKLSPSGVQYDRFIPLMLVEMNRLNDENEDLKKRIEKLEKLILK